VAAVYCQWVPLYPPVGYTGITQWAGVVPEGTRVHDREPGSMLYLVTAALLVFWQLCIARRPRRLFEKRRWSEQDPRNPDVY